jgi:hypothetical protein
VGDERSEPEEFAVDVFAVLAGYAEVPLAGVELSSGGHVPFPQLVLGPTYRNHRHALGRRVHSDRLQQVLLGGNEPVPAGHLSGDPYTLALDDDVPPVGGNRPPPSSTAPGTVVHVFARTSSARC